jgi:hypothetical protein
LLSWLEIRKVRVTSIILTDAWLMKASNSVYFPSIKDLFVIITTGNLCSFLVSILMRCENLLSIHMECSGLTNDLVNVLITSLAMSCPRLVTCCIYGVPMLVSVVVLLSQRCPYLEEVSLGLSLSDAGVDAITVNCPNLKRIYLAGSRVTSLALEHLTLRGSQISAVDLTGCGGHSDEPLMGLLRARKSSFGSIILGYNDILNTSALLNCIATTQGNLSSLDFSFSMQITDDDMLVLCSNCKLLTTLNISSNKNLTPISGVVIANCLTRLRRADFSQGRRYRTKGLMYFISKRFKSFHALEYDSLVVGAPFPGPLSLTIEQLPAGSDWSCYEDPDFLSKLQLIHAVVSLEPLHHGSRLVTFIQNCGEFMCILDLSSCVKYAVQAVVPLEEVLTQTSLLHADRGQPGASDLSDVQLSVIALKCTMLEMINFSWNYHITDVGMVAVIHRNANLTKVLCSHCGALGDLTVVALSGCVHLLTVNFQRGGNISDFGLIRLANACPGLLSVNVVNVADNTAVTMVSVDAFRDCCPELQHVLRSNDMLSWSSTVGLHNFACSDMI